MNRVAAFSVLAAADAAVLALGRPDFATVIHGLAAPHAWVRSAGSDSVLVALSATALWIAAIWLACGLVALAATRLPGAAGRAADLVTRRLLPGAVRRMLAGSAGLSILVAPVAAGAAPHAADLRPPGPVAATLPSPSWPVDAPGAAPIPTPQWPATPAADQPARLHRSAQHEVRVRAGDSLWAIAARRLGSHATPASIAGEWPRWYSANRDVIGPRPDIIQPGQILHAPQDQS